MIVDTAMPDQELRSEERRSFNQQPTGEFSIRVGERNVPVLGLQDVSSSGLRADVSCSLGVSTAIRLCYRRDDIYIELNAITCWESPIADLPGEARTVGIELLSPTILINLL